MSVTYSIIIRLWKTVKNVTGIYKGLVIFCNKDLTLQNVTEGLVIYGRSCYNTLAKITTKMTLNDPN